MNRSQTIAAVLLAALLCAAPQARAVPIRLTTDINAYTTSTDLYQSDVSVPYFNHLLCVSRFGTDECRAALEFDISSLLPAGEQIDSAYLFLYATLSNEMVAVHSAIGNGTIETDDFTFTNAPADIVEFDPCSSWPPAENMVDVTTFIQDAAAGQNQFVVFQLREMFDREWNEFMSSRWEGDAFDPWLQVNTSPIPEPATLALLLTGGYAVLRRKRHP